MVQILQMVYPVTLSGRLPSRGTITVTARFFSKWSKAEACLSTAGILPLKWPDKFWFLDCDNAIVFPKYYLVGQSIQ